MKTKQVRYAIGLLLAMILSIQAQTAPTITKQPTNQVVSLGATATLTVAATGTPPLSYQWRHELTNIESGTTRTLTVTNIQLVHQGRYDVVVTNLSGLVTSQVATLTVDPTFTQITTGPIVTDTAGGWSGSWVDYDGDGNLDAIIAPYQDNLARSSLFHNEGDGTFSKVTNNAIAQTLMRPYMLLWGDYDNDGKVDLFVPNTGTMNDMLFHNNGNGSFTSITTGHPVIDAADSVSGVWGDYDRDGFLDLFVLANGCPGQNDMLYRGNGDGTFQKMTSAEVGPIVNDLRSSDYAVWADVDNDGWPELYRGLWNGCVANVSTTNQVWHVDGQGKFYLMDIGEMQKGNEGYSGITWADYDNDGLLDGLVGAGRGSFGLYRNLGEQGFTNVAASAFPAGLTNCDLAIAVDYDNDGWQDLVCYFFPLATSSPVLFRNNGDGTFTHQNVGGPSSAVGGWFYWGDYNNDGFLDILVVYNSGIRNSLFRHNGNTNHWLKVKLDGRASNRSGIGAKVRVNATIGGRTFWQMREISGQDGLDNGLIAHFGLGDATNVTTLRIEWPSGIVQDLQNVATNQFLTVVESQSYEGARPQFGAVTNGAGGLQLSLIEPAVGARFLLEASSDLVSWTKLMARTSAGNTSLFTDTRTTNYTSRFYRLQVP